MPANFFSADGVVAPWISSSFPIIRIVILILLVVIGVFLTFAVLIQPSGNESMGALTGQSSETYYSKNKKQSVQGLMKRLTVIFGIVMAVLAILFFVTLVIYPANLMGGSVPQPESSPDATGSLLARLF